MPVFYVQFIPIWYYRMFLGRFISKHEMRHNNLNSHWFLFLMNAWNCPIIFSLCISTAFNIPVLRIILGTFVLGTLSPTCIIGILFSHFMGKARSIYILSLRYWPFTVYNKKGLSTFGRVGLVPDIARHFRFLNHPFRLPSKISKFGLKLLGVLEKVGFPCTVRISVSPSFIFGF